LASAMYAPRVQVESFAYPIKEILASTLLMVDAQRNGYKSKDDWRRYINQHKHKIAIRTGLQYIGDQLGRGLMDSNIWVNALAEQILAHEELIIDDVRYPNEVVMLKKLDFRIIHIHRDPLDRESYIMNEARKANPHLDEKEINTLVTTWQCHPSEAQIPALDIDEVVEYNEFEAWIKGEYGNLR
jgi:hypothetical protein